MARASVMESERDDPVSVSALRAPPAGRSLHSCPAERCRSDRPAEWQLWFDARFLDVSKPEVRGQRHAGRWHGSGDALGHLRPRHRLVPGTRSLRYGYGHARLRIRAQLLPPTRGDADEVDYYCTAEPTVIVDLGNPGHATLPGALNFSPVSSVVFFASLLLSLLLVPLVLVACGLVSLVRGTWRRRRLLAGHSWEVHRYRVRGSRVHEGVASTVGRGGRCGSAASSRCTTRNGSRSLATSRVGSWFVPRDPINCSPASSGRSTEPTWRRSRRPEVSGRSEAVGARSSRSVSSCCSADSGSYDVFDLDGWPLGTIAPRMGPMQSPDRATSCTTGTTSSCCR